ncbi:MAG: hypothetical protein ACHQZR_02905 [Candidatus Limnocylindrales bacterium]
MLQDSATEVQLGYDDGGPGWAYVVIIGVPYGYGSAAALLQSFKTIRYPGSGAPVSNHCPQMASPSRSVLVGLSGFAFDCADAITDYVPIYPRTRRGTIEGVPASLATSGDWFALSKSGAPTWLFVTEVGGRAVVISIADGGPNRPGQPVPDSSERHAIYALDLRFGP